MGLGAGNAARPRRLPSPAPALVVAAMVVGRLDGVVGAADDSPCLELKMMDTYGEMGGMAPSGRGAMRAARW